MFRSVWVTVPISLAGCASDEPSIAACSTDIEPVAHMAPELPPRLHNLFEGYAVVEFEVGEDGSNGRGRRKVVSTQCIEVGAAPPNDWMEPNEFWMLTLYSKSKKDNVPGHVLRALLAAFRDE